MKILIKEFNKKDKIAYTTIVLLIIMVMISSVSATLRMAGIDLSTLFNKGNETPDVVVPEPEPEPTPTPTPPTDKEDSIVYQEIQEKREIPFETTFEKDDTIEEGKEVITQYGVPGEETMTYRQKFVNGVFESRELISTVRTKYPINQIVKIGTKPAAPVTPVDPDPTDPVDPTDPTNPTEPTEPGGEDSGQNG